MNWRSGLGRQGTGKTYLAVAVAVTKFISGEVDRIVLSRPAVEAGEKLGYLPGDMKDKVDPYMQPLYDALNDFLPSKQLAKLIEEKRIEIAPLAFMRGRTACPFFRGSGRSAKYQRYADENVFNAPWRRVADGDHRG